MKITYLNICTDRINRPALERVFSHVCEKCGFNQHRVEIQCIGGKRAVAFKGDGIKLIRPNKHAVQLYVGYTEDTFEVYFRLTKPNNNEHTKGSVLFNEMQKYLGGETFILPKDTEVELKKPTDAVLVPQNKPHNGEVHTSFALPLSDFPESEVAIKSGAVSETLPSKSAELEEVSVFEPVSENATNSEAEHTKYFDNPSKLHLVVCAIVSLCNENRQMPFSFDMFKQALEEAAIPKTVGLPLSLLKPFLRQGYIKRINPEVKPPRYVITELAVSFAREPEPKGVNSVKKMKPVIEYAPDRTKETILSLKQMVADHASVKNALSIAQKKLAEFQSIDFEEEERRIAGETASLQKRLGDLEKYRAELASKKEKIGEIRSEVDSLEEAVNDPKVKQALEQLAEIRKLLE